MARLVTRLMVAVTFIAAAERLPAQAIETPEPFDSAGRVTAITPALAARLELRPPAWRITGDYREAKLFRLGNEGWVIVVTRRTGLVERYAVSADERRYLAERTANVPSDFVFPDAEVVVQVAAQEFARNAFIRNQTILGLTVYAPAFAVAVTKQDAGRIATYLLVAGGSYFAASALSRDLPITPQMNGLATHAAVHGALAGLALTSGSAATSQWQGAASFVGGLGGTAAGLYFGRGMTTGDVVAASVGADAFALLALGLLYDPDQPDDFAVKRSDAWKIASAIGLLGYPAGALYARRARYGVTAGDVLTLPAAGALGAVAATAVLGNGDHRGRNVALAATLGFAGGLVAGDRLLVSRFDHDNGQGGLVALGAGAGALMGAGVGVLVNRNNDALLLAFAALGGATGIGAAEWFLRTPADGGRRSSARLEVNPTFGGGRLGMRIEF